MIEMILDEILAHALMNIHGLSTMRFSILL
jgi:hypothetical protein